MREKQLQKEKELKEKELQKEKELRDKELKEKESRDKELREKELREKELRDKELREKELREKELRDKELREKELREKESRDKELREKELRDKESQEKELQKEKISSDSTTLQPIAPSSSLSNINICDSCGQTINGSGIQAMNKRFHSQCFNCFVCKRQLTGSFMQADGNPYCMDDYNNLFSKTCGGCNKIISGSFINALGKQWHTTCFLCAKCSSPLSSGFYEKNSNPYCKNCV